MNRHSEQRVRQRGAARILVLALALASGQSAAQAPATTGQAGYPAKPVRVVIPVSPGGVQDTFTRVITQELARVWGQGILVESRPGANGIIAVDAVAKSAPDGYTILMADSAPITINPFLYNKLPYDPTRDLAPVIGLAEVAYLIVSSPQFPPNTLEQLLALARAKPGEINYASYGMGSSNHLETESLGNRAGVKFTHVPYKGGGELMPALLGGQIQFSLLGVTQWLPQLRQGRLKAIAYGAGRRSTLLPDVPTIAESGLPGYDARTWFGWFVPAATPRAIIDKVSSDVSRIITSPEFLNKYIISVGLELLNLPPDGFADYLKADRAKNQAKLKDIALRMD